ncbi:Cyclic AMP-responsive element-binding protein 1 [Fukomys damarensis]|uniref:Cyclic AMP-responsive element-binding protein 1 n=1 Tax=Fukomys damarensis TaxID=885580 RepID=A0A091DSM6_FUKDA|nr:Cyclic AMP-responsive element-binding protein 1 [Fukomys damarensis]
MKAWPKVVVVESGKGGGRKQKLFLLWKTSESFKVLDPFIQLIMEESHKNNTSETSTRPAPTVQGVHISHIAQQISLRGSAPVTVVPLPGEQIQVQGVIQTAQSSVIHPPHVHTVSSLSESEESQDSSDSIGSSQKAHGILARRPSYRSFSDDPCSAALDQIRPLFDDVLLLNPLTSS